MPASVSLIAADMLRAGRRYDDAVIPVFCPRLSRFSRFSTIFLPPPPALAAFALELFHFLRRFSRLYGAASAAAPPMRHWDGQYAIDKADIAETEKMHLESFR